MRKFPSTAAVVRREAVIGLAAFVFLCDWQDGGAYAAEEVLATVKGSPVREADLRLEAVLRRIPPDQVDARRSELLEDVVDLRLIKLFLSSRRIKANTVELNRQVETIHALIGRGDEEPAEFFERVGLTEEQLRDRLALGLAWESYVLQITTAKQLRQYFDDHKRELDGTQLRARHIILKTSPDDPNGRETAVGKLADLRRQIESGSLSFADAAARHSEGPSSRDGGDVGFFPHRGMMSADFADAAFKLNVGELSEPVTTTFGVHLIEVTDERPGQLSLEDVRGQVLSGISRRMWSEQVARERTRVPITRTTTKE